MVTSIMITRFRPLHQGGPASSSTSSLEAISRTNGVRLCVNCESTTQTAFVLLIASSDDVDEQNERRQVVCELRIHHADTAQLQDALRIQVPENGVAAA